MARKVYIKPPQPTGTMLKGQMVLSALFLPWGIMLAFVAEGEARPFAAFFALIWVVACLSMFIYSLKMLRVVKKGKIEIAELSSHEDTEKTGGFASRLRDLEALKKEGLIHEDEYTKKRQEILKEKW